MKTAETQPILTANHAAVLMQFLQRTSLQGHEVPAYAELYNILGSIVAAASAPAETSTDNAA